MVKLKSLITESVKVTNKPAARVVLLPVIKTLIKKGIITSNIYSEEYAPEMTDKIIEIIETIKD